MKDASATIQPIRWGVISPPLGSDRYVSNRLPLVGRPKLLVPFREKFRVGGAIARLQPPTRNASRPKPLQHFDLPTRGRSWNSACLSGSSHRVRAAVA